MAIHTMTTDPIRASYTLDETHARILGWDTTFNGPLMIETTYEGCVIRIWERNGYDDSDFIAQVWDDSRGEVIQVVYASTRGWSYANSAKVDVTPEVMEKIEKWHAALKLEQDRQDAIAELATVRVGKTVRIVKGRKIAKGTVATVLHIARNEYDASNPKVMVQFERKIVTTYMNNLEVVHE